MAKFQGISARSKVDALCIAAANSMLKEMRALISDGVDINAISSDGYTPLSSATQLGLTRSIDLLLEHGADINIPSWEDMTPLMLACSQGKAKGSKIAIRLMEEGADVNYVRKSDGMTALKFSVGTARPEVIQMLIDLGAEVDGPSNTELTALMLAARKNNPESLKVLIENGADLSIPCGLPWADKMTALELAKFEGCRKAVKYLLSVTSATG